MIWPKRKQKFDSSIKPRDPRSKQEEGRKNLYPLFREITETHVNEILDFTRNFKKPDDNLLNFSSDYKFRVVHSSGALETYVRAMKFLDLRSKYSSYNIFTGETFKKFRRIMNNKYDLDIGLDQIQSRNINITDDVAREIMVATRIIEQKDGDLNIFGTMGGKRTYVDDDDEALRIFSKLEGKKFGEPVKINYEEESDITKFVRENWVRRPHSYSYGCFIAIVEGQDPIICAELSDDMYLEICHMPVIPEDGQFLV